MKFGYMKLANCMQEIEQSGAPTRYSGAPSESIQSTIASSQDINGQTTASMTAAAKRRRQNVAAMASSTDEGNLRRCGHCCRSVWSTLAECLRAGPAARRRRYDSMKPLARAAGQMNSVSEIDTISRFLFPFAFVALNILYWAGFLYYL